MADSIDLLSALVRAARQCGIAPENRLPVMQVADLISQDPALAAAWARVLTEHTAPKPAEALLLHQYNPAGCTYPDGVTCHQEADSAVHRAEEPTDRQAHLLRMHSVGPAQFGAARLIELGLVDEWTGDSTMHRITPRGRAWLEAHPREGGEPR